MIIGRMDHGLQYTFCHSPLILVSREFSRRKIGHCVVCRALEWPRWRTGWVSELAHIRRHLSHSAENRRNAIVGCKVTSEHDDIFRANQVFSEVDVVREGNRRENSKSHHPSCNPEFHPFVHAS